ncbi:MAG: phage integrase SAM-like domain-containing protein [Campylobacterota bacterium]|nr:phage integrase SAM-like domain-containing protein [Campylobacterota bacterium]
MKIEDSEYTSITDDLWISDSGDKFYYSFMISSKKFSGKLDYSTKNWNSSMKLAVAKTTVSKLKAKHKQLIIKNPILTFDSFIQKSYSLTQKSNFVQIDYYEKYIKRFIGLMEVSEINHFEIKKIFDFQYYKNLKLSTLKITYSFLHEIFSLAVKRNIIKVNPCNSFNINVIQENIYLKTIKEKLNEIYNVSSIVFQNQPSYLAFILFILHGRRKKDIMNLRWELIDFDNNSFVLKVSKKKNHYLHPTIKEELLKVRKKFGFIYHENIELVEINSVDIRQEFAKINNYIPEFSISNMEYLVEQLQERQVFGEDISIYSSEKDSSPHSEQKLIAKSKIIKPKLNIGKFSKKT